VVDELAGVFNFDIGQQVDLYASPANYISTGSTTITTPGTKIGTARIRSFVYQDGDIGKFDCKYRMYLFDINMNSGQAFSATKSIYYGSGNKAIADVVLDATLNIAVLQDTRDSSLLFKLKTATSNAANITYQYRSINTTEQANSDGYVVLNLTTGEYFPYTEELNPSEIRDLIVTPNGNFKSQAPATGTVAVNSNTTVTGTSSLFNVEFAPGDFVLIANSTGGNTTSGQIASIANSTSMTLVSAATKTYSGGSITLYYPQNIPISLSKAFGPASKIFYAVTLSALLSIVFCTVTLISTFPVCTLTARRPTVTISSEYNELAPIPNQRAPTPPDLVELS
jgi:hypothetical protein